MGVPDKMKTMKQDSDFLKRIMEWDAENPEMPPIDVPKGYRADYLYAVPVERLAEDKMFLDGMSYEDMDGFGLVHISAGSEMDDREVSSYMGWLEENGIRPVGSMRLVRQTFFLK